MALEVELSSLDLRYESYRMRNPGLEARLLASIMERGIEEPLEGVDSPGGRLLLNGFKRYRSAAGWVWERSRTSRWVKTKLRESWACCGCPTKKP
ncbi:MAG: hypothetical protein ACE15E_05575 [Acidobacteriota bacterium]